MILLKNGLILDGDKLTKKDVLIDGERIVKIEDEISVNFDTVIKDVSGKWVIPGAVDVHAHLREPGFEHKETVKTGSLSAVKGGITAMVTMPNLNPVPDSIENLEIYEKIIKRDALNRIYPSASVTVGQKGEKICDCLALNDKVIAFTEDGLWVKNFKILKELMQKSTKIILSHAECADAKTSEEAEYLAVRLELELVRETGCKYHFCHMSTKESFEALKSAKDEGLDVSLEVSPHHLFLNKSQIVDANFKMNPPLRDETDRLATVKALLDGVATIIATDHAPHSENEKNQPYEKAPNGIIGFETLLPLVYTNLVKTKLATHKQMLDWVVFNPAKRFNIPNGEIKVGGLADIAVLDIETEREYQSGEILSKSKNSPFIGQKLFGFNVLTIVSGKIVYDAIS